MAIKPQDNTAFMREVDEEVRKERTVDFWRRWGTWIVIALVAGLIAFGGWLYWQNRQEAAREAAGETLNQLLLDIDSGNLANVEPRLDELGESDAPGYRAAAMLTRAALALQAGDNAAAARGYAAIAADESLAQPYRDIALIRQTAVEFGTLEPQAVIDRLSGLSRPGHPFFGSAGEMTAISLMALGRAEEAGRMFAAIANEETAPPTLRTRAVQMAGALGVDAVPDDEVPTETVANPVAEEASE